MSFFSLKLAEIKSTGKTVQPPHDQQPQMEQHEQQEQQAPQRALQTGRKRKVKSKKATNPPPKKKPKKDVVGETVEEVYPIEDDSAFQSTMGESIYEDFDDHHY